SRRRHTRWPRDWSSDVCSSDLRVFLQMVNTYRGWRYLEEVGGECLDVGGWDPRRPEVGVDVPWQHVLGLHLPQGFGVAGVSRPQIGRASCREGVGVGREGGSWC